MTGPLGAGPSRTAVFTARLVRDAQAAVFGGARDQSYAAAVQVGMRAIDVFSKIYDAPAVVRTRLLTVGIPRVIALTRGLKICVEAADSEQAVTTMPLSSRSRNHLGSIYIGALLVQAEITMATLVISLFRPPAFRVLVKKSEAEYHARAEGTVRARCAPDGDERDGLLALRALVNDKGEAWVTVLLESAADARPLASMRFLVAVKHNAEYSGIRLR